MPTTHSPYKTSWITKNVELVSTLSRCYTYCTATAKALVSPTVYFLSCLLTYVILHIYYTTAKAVPALPKQKDFDRGNRRALIEENGDAPKWPYSGFYCRLDISIKRTVNVDLYKYRYNDLKPLQIRGNSWICMSRPLKNSQNRPLIYTNKWMFQRKLYKSP